MAVPKEILSSEEEYRGRMSDLRHLGHSSVRPNVELPALSYRESYMLEQTSLGINDCEIAGRLFVVPGAVRIHLSNAAKRLGAQNTPHAVKVAIEKLILPIDIGDTINEELSEEEIWLLRQVADGKSFKELSLSGGLNSSWKLGVIYKSMALKLNAQSKAHAVRRGYETGQLVPEFDIPSEQ
jgi:DNA-binding CsgD family transcriptional regulator